MNSTASKKVRIHLDLPCNSDRSRRSSFSAKDLFSLMLKTLKHGGDWDFLGRIIKIKGSTFEIMVMYFMGVVSDVHYEEVVTK